MHANHDAATRTLQTPLMKDFRPEIIYNIKELFYPYEESLWRDCVE
jgi:hypothetical protein